MVNSNPTKSLELHFVTSLWDMFFFQIPSLPKIFTLKIFNPASEKAGPKRLLSSSGWSHPRSPILRVSLDSHLGYELAMSIQVILGYTWIYLDVENRQVLPLFRFCKVLSLMDQASQAYLCTILQRFLTVKRVHGWLFRQASCRHPSVLWCIQRAPERKKPEIHDQDAVKCCHERELPLHCAVEIC